MKRIPFFSGEINRMENYEKFYFNRAYITVRKLRNTQKPRGKKGFPSLPNWLDIRNSKSLKSIWKNGTGWRGKSP